MTVLAIDLGGTRLKSGVVDAGRLVEPRIEPAPADGTAETLEEAIRRCAADRSFDSVGLSVPGLVDADGIVVSLPGKHDGIEGLDLPALLRRVTGAGRVLVVNDAIAYATGEAIHGAGAGVSRVVVATIGTGVGVAVIEHGAPVTRGVAGGGILGGSIPISERSDGPLDSNGRPGTIEALCAATRLAEACGASGVEEAYAAIERDDPAAIAGLRGYREHLVRALVALAHAHAPERIVLGGGPMILGNPVTPGLEDAVNDRLFGSYRVELRLAALGDTAALLGLGHLTEHA